MFRTLLLLLGLFPCLLFANSQTLAEGKIVFIRGANAPKIFAKYEALLQRVTTGQLAPDQYQQTMEKIGQFVQQIARQDPGSLRFAIANRQRWRAHCPKQVRQQQICTCHEDFALAKRTLFARGANGQWLTRSEYRGETEKTSDFSQLAPGEFQELVIAAYAQESRHFVAYVGKERFHRERIIREIKTESDWGKFFLETERIFLETINRPWWEETFETHSDQEGNFQLVGEFTTPTGLLRSFMLGWRGKPYDLGNFELTVNGESFYNEAALSYEEYVISKEVGTKSNRFSAVGENGKKDSAIEVVLSDCGCGE